MKRCWFKMWYVGNGGIPSPDEWRYWSEDAEIEEAEHELGPFSSGVRGVYMEKATPPKEVIEERIKQIKRHRAVLESQEYELTRSLMEAP